MSLVLQIGADGSHVPVVVYTTASPLMVHAASYAITRLAKQIPYTATYAANAAPNSGLLKRNASL